MWVADRKLWMTATGEIVEDGDPRARVLIAIPGTRFPSKPKIKSAEPGEDKAIKPVENKRRTKK